MQAKLTPRQWLPIFASVWAAIWIAYLGAVAFKWHTLPADRFQHFFTTQLPIMMMILICLPLTTLLPILNKARTEKKLHGSASSEHTNGLPQVE